MGAFAENRAHHNTGCTGREVVLLLDFKASHRKLFSQAVDVTAEGNQFPKPLQRYAHEIQLEAAGSYRWA